MNVRPITNTGEHFSIECSRTELWSICHAMAEQAHQMGLRSCENLAQQSQSIAGPIRVALNATHASYHSYLDGEISRLEVTR